MSDGNVITTESNGAVYNKYDIERQIKKKRKIDKKHFIDMVGYGSPYGKNF